MDFNTGNLNFNKKNNKRKAQSVQEMIGNDWGNEADIKANPIRKSAYSGPYKRNNTGAVTGNIPGVSGGRSLNSNTGNLWGGSPIEEGNRSGRASKEGRHLGRTGNTGKIVLPERRDVEEEFTGRTSSYDGNGSGKRKKSRGKSSGVELNHAGIIYTGILVVCMVTSLITYTVSGGSANTGGSLSQGKKDAKIKATYDLLNETPSSQGIVNELVSAYVTGVKYVGAGEKSGSSSAGLPSASAGAASETPTQTTNPDGSVATTNGPDAASGMTSSGAAMIIDNGQGMAGYTAATSHSELVSQIENALATGDTAFVGMKLAYKDEYGELIGYPQSVVDHFTSYMASNAEKRAEFINLIKGDSYSATNGTAYVVELQAIQFVVNMGYDNTTVSVEGFGDQVLNSGQQGIIKPLLPCMYTVTLSNSSWESSVVKEVEANLSELTLNLNVT